MKVAASVLLFSISFTNGALLRDAGILSKDQGALEAVPVPDGVPERLLLDSEPYQVDPNITRVELVGAHTKWLFCSSAFWALDNGQCETTQRYVPDGYWFETGRPVPPGKNGKKKKCRALTGNGDVPVVQCSFKRGLTMVLPVANNLNVACTDGVRDNVKDAVLNVLDRLSNVRVVKATLDGVNVSRVDAIPVVTQDGDADYTMPGPGGCNDALGYLGPYEGCPLLASGPYVFVETKNLAIGPHELILIGEFISDGGCSAVKHKFTLY